MKQIKIFSIILIVLFCSILGGFILNDDSKRIEKEWECNTETKPILLYGINVDTLNVDIGEVKKNETLTDILINYGLSNLDILDLIQNTRSVFNPRQLKPGDKYTILYNRTDKKATHFIVEPDLTEYVMYHFVDSVFAEKFENPINKNLKFINGFIQTSVYEDILAMGGTPLLVYKLVDILAWQVDFFRVQKGDEFKVMYEELSIDDNPVGIGKVYGVYFKHFNTPNYAIYYEECGKADYFDECGNSVRRTFLKAPLEYKRISSGYSPRRFHPILKRYRPHRGTDYAASRGTPIRTVGSGIVTEAQYGRGIGNYVAVRHNSTYTTKYYHMSKFARGIRKGKIVNQGDIIGYVGSTGFATGPHVCFRFLKNGVEVNPFTVDMPPAKPIDPSESENFYKTRNIIMKSLDSLHITKSNTI